MKFQPRVSQGVIDDLNIANGATIIERIPQINVLRLRISGATGAEQAAAAYRKNPNVEYAEVNYIAQTLDTIPNDPAFTKWEWAVKQIRAPSAWDITTGSSSVVIAIVDTGIDATHDDLSGKVLAGYNFVANNANTADDHGHGTGVAGVAAASTNNGVGMAGVSWESPLMPLKVCDAGGSCTYANVARGIIWAADYGARVINISLGGATACGNTFQSAIDYAWNKGTVIVAAAGNQDAAVRAPANCNRVIAVGATDGNDVRTSWSNYGSELDVVAPGIGVTCTALNNSIGQCSGTSFSSPLTAGTAALLFAAGAGSNSAVATAVTNGADDLGNPGWDPYYGWGRINAYRSLLSLSGSAPPTPTPTPTAAPSPTPTPTRTATSSPTPTPTPIRSPADATPPAVTLTQPGQGQTVRGQVALSASASDNVGVAKVGFYVDGALHKTDTSAPYSVSWNSRRWGNGPHSITAKAFDAAGNEAAATHTVYVEN